MYLNLLWNMAINKLELIQVHLYILSDGLSSKNTSPALVDLGPSKEIKPLIFTSFEATFLYACHKKLILSLDLV